MRRRVTAVRERFSAPAAKRALIVCLFFLPQAALGVYDPERLSELIREGRHQDAWAYAVEHRAEREGELAFDLYYGIAAVESGELEEAVFALERVVAREPGFDRARLELARAYFLQGDDRRARTAFEMVLARDPPPPVREQIGRHLSALDRRADRFETRLSGFVDFSVGHDSNVNAATDEESVAILGGLADVLLSEESRELEDEFTRVEARGRVSHPLSPGVNLVGEAGLWQRSLGKESAFETAAFDARLGVMWRDGDSRLHVSGELQRFYLDGETYRDLIGLVVRHDRAVSDDLRVDFSARVSDLDHDDRPSLDSTLLLLDGGFSHTFSGDRRPVLTAGLFLGTEDADDDTNAAQSNTDRDIVGARAAVWLALAPRWSLRGRFEFSHSEYAEENELFGETREEDYHQTGVAVDWRPDAHWRIGPQLEYTRNDANLELFEYERTELQIRARYEFY